MRESINHYSEKIKPYLGLICVTVLTFLLLGFWQLHALAGSKTGLKIVNMGENREMAMGNSETVIASKTGTKYYLPWCGALSRIKEENRISFASPALARQAGYEPAGNCKGVK